MTLLAIDPGKNVGWALFDDSGVEMGRGVLDLDTQLDNAFWFLDTDGSGGVESLMWDGVDPYKSSRITEIVCESYLGRPNQKNGGQRFWGPEALATVRTYAHLARVPFHLQAPTVLPVAKAHAGYVQTVKHLPDQDSAYLHGFEFLVARGVLQPVPLDD